MHLQVFSVHAKLPTWIEAGSREYLSRIPPSYWKIDLKPFNLRKTEKDLWNAIPPQSLIISLDSRGVMYSSLELQRAFEKWQNKSSRWVFVIGGPDGLSSDFLDKSHEVWSLSSLTFPHGLAQLLLLEQLYRVYSLIKQHPYHRF